MQIFIHKRQVLILDSDIFVEGFVRKKSTFQDLSPMVLLLLYRGNYHC